MMIEHPMAILAVFLVVIAATFNMAAHPVLGRFFRFVPPIVFCYFVPTILTTIGILPDSSPLYKWIKTFMLPVALFLFTLSLDLKTIIKLGPKAVSLMIIGTAGVVIGGPIALYIFKGWLPPDAWQGMAALAGSWIGGGANFVAIGQAVEAPDSILGPIIVVDVVVASVWMGFLIFMADRKEKFNNWVKADRSIIEHVQKKIEDFQASVARVTAFTDLTVMIALAFVCTWLAYWLGKTLPPVGDFISGSTWRVIIITTLGVIFSFTRVRNYEGAGASKLGNIALYLLITTIGAQADLRGVIEYPVFIAAGTVWILIHGVFLLIAAKLLRAPLFFAAVGSQANIGAAASAPVVAAAFHPALMPVGILMGVFGYVLGTYAGLLCAYLLRAVAMM